MSEEIQFTKSELLERIETSWSELSDAVAGLDEAALTRVDPDSGWSIADHLNHLAAWERGIAYLLSRRPRHEGMGVSAEQWRDLTMDEINDEVHRLGQGRSAADALAHSRDAHAEMLAVLADLEVADLLRSYSDYDQEGAFPGRPVVGWVVGNTFAHYEEHLGYIREALGR